MEHCVIRAHCLFKHTAWTQVDPIFLLHCWHNLFVIHKLFEEHVSNNWREDGRILTHCSSRYIGVTHPGSLFCGQKVQFFVLCWTLQTVRIGSWLCIWNSIDWDENKNKKSGKANIQKRGVLRCSSMKRY
jgi:hypothetical protein